MAKQVEQFYWHTQPPVQEALVRELCSQWTGQELVVEIGPGWTPWPLATEFIDLYDWKPLAKEAFSPDDPRKIHRIDVSRSSLPYGDKQVDFLYCRHVLEDLDNPLQLCAEIDRVAKAGYIETPSPVEEFCRGVDGAVRPSWRGHKHHRFLIWHEGGELVLLPKLPLIEQLGLQGDEEDYLAESLNRMPLLWNTYFPWRDAFKFRVLPTSEVIDSYMQIIGRALALAFENTRAFAAQWRIGDNGFIPIS
jgi:hypothetical protein